MLSHRAPRNRGSGRLGLWLLACLCYPLAYLRWYGVNRGRIGAGVPWLLAGTTTGILGLIYLDFPMMFQTAPALLLLWSFGGYLTLLFLVTRPVDHTPKLVSDRVARALMSTALPLFAIALNLMFGSLSRVAHRSFFTRTGVALFCVVFLWALIGAYLTFKLPDDAHRAAARHASVAGASLTPSARAGRTHPENGQEVLRDLAVGEGWS